MTFIRWWTVGVMLMSATMALTLSVVSLQYYVYRNAAPEIPQEIPQLLLMVALFTLLAIVGAAAFLPLRRPNRWLWPSQALLLISAVGIGMTFWNLLRS